MRPSIIVDTRGLFCPMPVIKTSEAVKKIDPGACVEVVSDDPAIESDLPAWCSSQGHTIRSMEKDDNGVFRFIVEKRMGAK
ncbi:MAG: sulfurtransferase TusA family protein [Candidatus Latescibacterota bacterium]|nr:MAG: sulfurtransferase TusA family protein [Candidatus Latescibacterota bacterium]